jgi:hypothetical protein
MCTDYYGVAYDFKFAPRSSLHLTQISLVELTFHGIVLQSVAFVAFVRVVAGEKFNHNSFKFFGLNKIISCSNC